MQDIKVDYFLVLTLGFKSGLVVTVIGNVKIETPTGCCLFNPFAVTDELIELSEPNEEMSNDFQQSTFSLLAFFVNSYYSLLKPERK